MARSHLWFQVGWSDENFKCILFILSLDRVVYLIWYNMVGWRIICWFKLICWRSIEECFSDYSKYFQSLTLKSLITWKPHTLASCILRLFWLLCATQFVRNVKTIKTSSMVQFFKCRIFCKKMTKNHFAMFWHKKAG